MAVSGLRPWIAAMKPSTVERPLGSDSFISLTILTLSNETELRYNIVMNNIVILIFAIITLLISFVAGTEPGDEAFTLLGCLICVPAICVSLVGIVIGKNFFEC